MRGRHARWIVAGSLLAAAMSVALALAYWSAAGAGSATAQTASLGAATIGVPTSSYNTVTIAWTQQASLQPASAANSSITYSVQRRLGSGAWAAVSSGGCSGAQSYGTASCIDTLAAGGSYSYRVVSAYGTWTATSGAAGPVAVVVDGAAPANAITLSGVVGGAYKSGSTVFYRGAAAGSFQLTNAVTDSGGSGAASSRTAALGGTATGWTHSPSLVTAPAGGPYVSATFSWGAFTSTAPTEVVTGSDAAGNTAATGLTFTNDALPASGGAVDATGLAGTGGRYSTSTALSVAFTTGTDAGSGVAGEWTYLYRDSALLSDGICGTYGAMTQVGVAAPTSPVANTVPIDHACYRYHYVVLDRVGNMAVYTSADIKVDTAAAHPDFLQPITSPEIVQGGPASMDVGDVDNDGDQDIVMGNIFSHEASVLLNNGVASFRKKTVVANAATIDAGLGHFDRDGNLDLVLLYQLTSPATGLLIIFKGGGDGSFTYLGTANDMVSTGIRSAALAVGNFNGDAIDDVAVVNSQHAVDTTAGTVMTFMGDPAGTDTFAAGGPAQTLTAQNGATDIVLADFNGGSKDLVVANYASQSITFMAGNGAGFDTPAHVPAGVPVQSLAAAQLNAGTDQDLVASVRDSSPSAIRTLFGDGAGGFPTQATISETAAAAVSTPLAVVAKDFDGDGDADVAIANGVPSSISVFANTGGGGYAPAPASPERGVGGAGTLPYGLVSADFDGSGYNDLVASPVFTAPGEVRPLLNQNGNRANLSVTQSDAPDPVAAGQNLTYTLTVANASATTPSNVKVTDDLPAGVTFNAAASSSSCTAAGSAPVTVTCSYGAVASGAPEAQQIVVTTGATATSLTNTATVAGNLADPTPANNTSTSTTAVVDATGPTGGSIDATGLVGTGSRYSTSTTLSLTLAKGTDPAGLAPSGAQLRRSTATLTSTAGVNGTCGSYGASVPVGAAEPVSPVADTVPAGQACYRYEYIVADTAGNPTTYTSPDIKVDTTAPSAPAVAFSALTNTFWSGSRLFYRSNATSGAFTVTASATDANSGIAGYALPALGTGWTATPGTLGVRTYSWSAANPAAPVGVQNATATNHATLASAAGGFTLTSDVAPPADGSVTYTNGYRTAASVSVSFAAGTDTGGAGVSATARLLQRGESTLTESTGACGDVVSFATLATNPASPFIDSTGTNGKCYQYRYLVSDNVGNQATYTSTSVVRVDTSAPTLPGAVNVTSGPSVTTTLLCGVPSGTRYINNAGAVSVAVSAAIPNLEAGETVVFSATTPGSTPVIVTAPAIATTLTTMNLTTLLDGVVTLTAHRIDAAGNSSLTRGPANTIVKDVVAKLSSLSYNDRTLQPDQILGTSECGATITAAKSGGTPYVSDVLTGTSFTLQVQTQALFSYSYNVTARDLAGNTSPISVVSGSAFL